MSRLSEICRSRVGLGEDEITRLEQIELQLPLIAALTDADVFLDCFLDSRTAIVVAQARPRLGSSSYEKEVVGELALPEQEPAVFHARITGMPVCDLKAITQEDKAVRQNVAPIFGSDGEVVGVIIREKDVSAALRREQKYAQLACSHENETRFSQQTDAITMREIHHRVKNNLQLVASILDLQAQQSDDPRISDILRENIGRVLSIASIHDILTKNAGEITAVHSTMLLEKLKSNLQMLIPTNKDIALITAGDDIVFDSDTATSVALVLTELVTNALQHAFEGRPGGTVTITFCAGTLYHTVSVKDNGNGIPDHDLNNANSLGLSIVRAIVGEKLKGKLRISTDGSGTKVSFDFKHH